MGNIKNISELLPDEPLHTPIEDEIEFNNAVREYIVFGVLLLILSVSSHLVILRFRRKDLTTTFPHSVASSGDYDEAIVDRVALWLCTFSLSVSLGAVLLLPISIILDEFVTIYGETPLMRKANMSFIQGWWNMIFVFSNVSLFVGLPFAYLFTESEGFPGSKKGLKARIIETVVVLMLLVVLVLGVSFILSILLGYYEQETIAQTIDVWSRFYLPFMYSIISCLGVLFLLLCTPVGLAHLFTVLGQLVLKPSGFLRDISEDYEAALYKEEALAHHLQRQSGPNGQAVARVRKVSVDTKELVERYNEAKDDRIKIEKRRKAGLIRRNLSYPLAVIVLIFLTCVAIFAVCINMLQLLVGLKALPLATTPAILGPQSDKRMALLSVMGPLGAALEIILILYLIAASLLGCYSLPFMRGIRPHPKDTPMTHVIANCVVVLLLSSALPLLVRTLGITNFDLLGDYGEIGWLGNFWIVLGYNVLFATAGGWCLTKKFTYSLRQAIWFKLVQVGQALWKSERFLKVQVIQGSMIKSTNIKEE